MDIKELQSMIMEQALAKGFGTKPKDIIFAEKIALIHSELSEVYEAYRKNEFEGRHGVKEELGDTFQRILHLCGIFDIDIEEEVLKKLEINKGRSWKSSQETIID